MRLKRLLCLCAVPWLVPFEALAQNIVLQTQSEPSSAQTTTQPTIDGIINTAEYVDGKKLILQDFNHIPGGPDLDGHGFILVSGRDDGDGDWNSNCNPAPCRPRTLFLGLELPFGTPTAQGSLEIYLDDDRPSATITTLANAADRKIEVSYPSVPFVSAPIPVAATVRQYQGPNWTTDITGTAAAWPMHAAIAYQGGGRLQFEVRVQLPEDIITTDRMFGLGVRDPYIQGAGPHKIPNNTGAFSPRVVLTWATVELREYDAIPLEITSYNVGQMPTLWVCPLVPEPCAAIPLPDGGFAQPPEIADKLYNREISCVNEVWARADREELVEEINSRREQENKGPIHAAGLPPEDNPDDDGSSVVYFLNQPMQLCLWVPYGSFFLCEDQGVDQYTGLLVLSERAQLQSEVLEFGEQDSGQCYGTVNLSPTDIDAFANDIDCDQDKGMIWARVLTAGSEPDPTSVVTGVPPRTSKDTSQFIDVFCSHTDSYDDQEDRDAREAEFVQLDAWIDARRAPDRPAILAGDLNVDARSDAHGEYSTMKNRLGIDALTLFDLANTSFSDIYDIPAFSGGVRVGTEIEVCNAMTEVSMVGAEILDYVLLLPPPATLESFPNFAVKKNPALTVQPWYDTVEQDCYSDHAMITASIELIATYEPGKWNASRGHVVRHSVGDVWDFEEGAESESDWFSSDHWMHKGTTIGSWTDSCNQPQSGGEGNTHLGWTSCAMSFSTAEVGGTFVELDDEEGAGTTDFDTSDLMNGANDGQRNAHFVFEHAFGRWTRATGSWSTSGGPSFYNDLNPPPDQKTFQMGFEISGDGVIGGDTEVDYNARLLHILTAVEE